MSTVFSLYTSDPNLLRCELRRVRDVVLLAPGAEPPEASETSGDSGGERHNAVGLGSYDDDNVLMHRYPSSDQGGMPNTVDALGDHKTGVLLFHGRSLPVGTSLEDNTQPFRFRRWLFAHGGELEGYRSFKQRLWEELPDHLKRQIRGETDSEVAFALFLKELRDAGRTDDRQLEPAKALELLMKTARHLRELSLLAAPDRQSCINLIATNEEVLVACRFGPTPLYYRVLEGRSECDLHPLSPRSPEAEPKLREHQRCQTVAIASNIRATAALEGWSELGEGEGLAIGPGAELQHAEG